jgi:SOS-response transcriptional repressor LexA
MKAHSSREQKNSMIRASSFDVSLLAKILRQPEAIRRARITRKPLVQEVLKK